MEAIQVTPYRNENSLFRLQMAFSILIWAVLLVATIGGLLVYLLFGYLFYVFGFSYFISYVRGTGARITPEQFPDLYSRLESGCRRLDIQQIPEAFLLQSDGVLNALAAKFLGRHFVVLFSPVVDALESRPNALDFYIGHELGHIHRRHTSWLKSVLVWPGSFLPLVGAAYRRAQEYTCDRYGYALCNTPDDAEYALAVMSAGSRRWAAINRDAFIAQTADTRGFWMSYHELMSDYPWLSKRMLALRALTDGTQARAPRRHLLAKILAFFSPRVPGAGGLGSMFVVVAIIGILAAIALPAYQDYTVRAQLRNFDMASQQILQHLQTNAGTIQNANAALADLTASPSAQEFSKYGDLSVEESGVVTLTPHTGAEKSALSSALPGKQETDKGLSLVPSVKGEQVQWKCQTQRRASQRPTFCR